LISFRFAPKQFPPQIRIQEFASRGRRTVFGWTGICATSASCDGRLQHVPDRHTL